jgi:hypothetical protein
VNTTLFNQCIKQQGVSCYCKNGLNNANTNIQCDSENRIIALKFVNLNFTANLPFMKNFTHLQDLDLSMNKISSVDSLSNLLPNSLKNLNLSYNSIQNSGEHYEILKEEFTQFTSLSLEGNQICGIFPSSWLKNSYSLYLKNHKRSFWCNQLNTASCSNLQLSQQNYVLLPHETSLFLNYSTSVLSECENYLSLGNLSCRSVYSTNSKEFPVKSSNVINNIIECSRSEIYNETDQFVELVWKYNSSLVEKISTQVHVINLKYSNILKTDPHLILYNSSGTFEMNVTCDQNMTRYRKKDSDSIYCLVTDENNVKSYFEAFPIPNFENIVQCKINLENVNQVRYISLTDSTKQFALTANPRSFWFINSTISNPEISMFDNQTILLKNANGLNLNGYSTYSYRLINTEYSINIPCSFGSNQIQSCEKSNSVSLPLNIVKMNLDFNDGIQRVSSISTLFYEKNQVQSIYPQAILANEVADVYLTFNKSTFNTTLQSIQYDCVDVSNRSFSALVMNSTTIKCKMVSSPNSIEFSFNIRARLETFEWFPNKENIKFNVISKTLFPSFFSSK